MSTRNVKSNRHTVGYQMHKFVERFSTPENSLAMTKHLMWLVRGIQEGERENAGTNHFSTPHDLKP